MIRGAAVPPPIPGRSGFAGSVRITSAVAPEVICQCTGRRGRAMCG